MQTDHPSIAKYQRLVEPKNLKPTTRKEHNRYARRLTGPFEGDPSTRAETASSGPIQETRLDHRPAMPDNFPARQQEPPRDSLTFVGFQSGRVMNQATLPLRCLAAQFGFHERSLII